ESFRQACRRFIYTENLVAELAPRTSAAASPDGAAPAAAHTTDGAVDILTKTIAQMETEDGWIGLRAVGQRLANVVSDFDPRTYGFRKLSDLVRQSGAFEIEETDGRAMRIRPKPAKPAAASGNRPRRRRRAS
ncbi:MAG: OST-HTH/LOTUS domain-containing protein, partial [Proteobacteria bacterium]|nr:OST-HTH/LOTUS domain-containing protein [Pseudomonadota bacterium]